MAIFQKNSGYRDANKALSIKALEARAKAAAEAAAGATQIKTPIADPMQGIAHLTGILGSSFQQNRADAAESSARQRLAEIRAGINMDTGPTSQQIADMSVLDSDFANKAYDEAMRRRQENLDREDRQKAALEELAKQQEFTTRERVAGQDYTTTEKTKDRDFTTTERVAGETYKTGREEDAQAAELEKQRLAAEEARKVADEAQKDLEANKVLDAALAPEIAQINAAVDAGTMTKEDAATAIEVLRAKSRPKASESVTPGQGEMDKKFAPEVLDWDMSGGPNATKALTQIDKALELLNANTGVGAPGIGQVFDTTGFGAGIVEYALPDFANKFVNRDGTIARDAIRETVQQTLRATLGSQFTEKEGQALMDRAFDISLPPGENIRRAKILLQQVAGIAKNKQAMVDHFKANNGTLEGYKGTPVDLAALDRAVNDDFDKADADAKAGGGDPKDANPNAGGAPVFDPAVDKEGDTGTDDAGNKWVVRNNGWVRAQ